MNPDQLLQFVIRPTLNYLGMGGHDAERLILGTAAVESGLGRYIAQHPAGPARGIWQMEPASEADIWESYLSYREPLRRQILSLMATEPLGGGHLTTNLNYACAMARLQYRRYPEPIPSSVRGMGELWKLRYNTPLGAGTVEKFEDAYERYITGKI